MIGANADVRPHHYRYERQRSDAAYVPFVHTRRYSGWWREALQAIGIIAFMVSAFLLAGGASALFGKG